MTGSATVVRGDALNLDIPDASVDLIVTSPPYFGLRSYQDGGEHYDGQIGSEPTPAEFVDALIAATREMIRVLKPSGSIWVNLGDKYARPGGGVDRAARSITGAGKGATARVATPGWQGAPEKSLIGVPWRYALRCIDELGLILRAEVIWSKPNGLPESVTDRVRRSHETWFHFVVRPRYFSAVDEVREEHAPQSIARTGRNRFAPDLSQDGVGSPNTLDPTQACNPLGKLPGSVWTIPTQPLKVPAHLGIDHFAAFPMEWPRRIIRGWSPAEVCSACGEGRRPVKDRASATRHNGGKHGPTGLAPDNRHGRNHSTLDIVPDFRITGYVCDCTPSHVEEVEDGRDLTVFDWHLWEPAPTTPGVVLDPFGGTGTTALVAKALGRHGISNDLSADYCRLAEWRTNDPCELARAMQVEKPDAVHIDQLDLFGETA